TGLLFASVFLSLPVLLPPRSTLFPYTTLFRSELIDLNRDRQELSLGIKTVNQDGRIFIKNVERGSAAWDAGLNVDDELIAINGRSEEHTSELQSRENLVCRLLLEKKKKKTKHN